MQLRLIDLQDGSLVGRLKLAQDATGFFPGTETRSGENGGLEGAGLGR